MTALPAQLHDAEDDELNEQVDELLALLETLRAHPAMPAPPPVAPAVTHGTCQKIIGTLPSGALQYCGSPTPRGASYCSEHHARIFYRKSFKGSPFTPARGQYD